MGRDERLYGAAAVVGAVAAGGGFASAGLPLLASGAAAVLGGVSLASCTALMLGARSRTGADNRVAQLTGELSLLRQHQAETDAKLVALEQRAIESPALVWRAATADIQVLGSLVSDLAQAVANHEVQLTGGAAPTKPQPDIKPQSPSIFLPQTSPPPASWFEDEAELGFTAEVAPTIASTRSVPASRAVHAPEVGNVPVTSPPSSVIAELKSTLAAALMSDRLELCLQPYVTLPQRKVVGYEAALRLKGENGELQGAEELRTAAAAAGMARDLDRILIERSGQVLRVLRARERVVSITCCVHGESLLDSGFRSAVETMVRGDAKLGQSIRLAVPLRDISVLRSAGAEALAALKRTGVALGATAGSDLGFDVASLAALGVTEVRVGAKALLAASGHADIHPADLSELLQRRGMTLMVDGIDSEAVVRDMLDFAAETAQGELFGDSRPVRPEVLQPREVAAPTAAARIKSAKAAEQAPRPQRQSFRSLLRRA